MSDTSKQEDLDKILVVLDSNPAIQKDVKTKVLELISAARKEAAIEELQKCWESFWFTQDGAKHHENRQYYRGRLAQLQATREDTDNE